MNADHQSSAPPSSHYEFIVSPESIASWVKPQAFSFMNQLEGWCSASKASVLIDLILKEKPDTLSRSAFLAASRSFRWPVRCAPMKKEKLSA